MSDDMRIQDDERKVSRQARIDLIRQIQEQQAQLDKLDDQKMSTKQLEGMSTTQLLSELERIAETGETDQAQESVDAVNTDNQATENRQDIQGQIGAQELARAESAHQVDGAQRSTEAVDAAHKQQDRGESWDKFQSADGADLPPNVEETAREERQREDAKQEEKDQISARDLQNLMAVQNRKIKS